MDLLQFMSSRKISERAEPISDRDGERISEG